MRKIFLVMITALSLAVVAGRESVVRGGEQASAADPGSDAPQPNSYPMIVRTRIVLEQ